MSPAKKKGADATAEDVESKINEIITDGVASNAVKMEVDYSETTDKKVRTQVIALIIPSCLSVHEYNIQPIHKERKGATPLCF